MCVARIELTLFHKLRRLKFAHDTPARSHSRGRNQKGRSDLSHFRAFFKGAPFLFTMVHVDPDIGVSLSARHVRSSRPDCLFSFNPNPPFCLHGTGDISPCPPAYSWRSIHNHLTPNLTEAVHTFQGRGT